jgi:hypothetical protein
VGPGGLGGSLRRLAAALLASAAALVLVPAASGAQAICSAPHSSPTLAQSGSLQTLPAGAGWIQLSGYGQNAHEFFNPDGSRQPFLADSEFTTRSAFLTAAYGLLPGLELWSQVPIHRLGIDAASGVSTSTGLGDLRFATRAGSELIGLDVPLALRAGLKVPGSDFPVDATVVPLTEGQVDLELSLESGVFLGELPIYLSAWLGYRWRTTNGEADRKPGNETFGHLAVGGFAGRFSWEVAADGLRGEAPVAQGITLEGEKRRLLQVLPTLGYGLGPGRLEVTAQIAVLGRNLPVASGLSLGYRYAWGL